MLSEILCGASKRYEKYKRIILSKIYYISLIQKVDIVVIDEHINAYQPRADIKKIAIERGEPIPVVFIPRKPHPNGLLAYITATYIKHPTKKNAVLPYVLDIFYHLQTGDVNPFKAIYLFMNK
ncbi:MAG: hypothetical protein K6U74_08090 [Firmicutes bacterium]|nr:hypothetical protein [Bacillota bacterium]